MKNKTTKKCAISILKKIAVGVGILILLILAGGFAYIQYLSKRGVPDYDGKTALHGLSADVTVYRDKHGIPHIYARNAPDLYRAVGYCMAQDRLFQMDLIRRVTTGTLAEVVGEKAVEIDHLMRAMRITEKSRLMISKTDAAVLDMVEAFCSGVNAFIETHRRRLPPEFAILRYVPRPWEPVHVFNVAGYMAFDLSTGWTTEVLFYKIGQQVGPDRMQEIMPEMESDHQVIFPEFKAVTSAAADKTLLSGARLLAQSGLTVFHGSNNWVVSGQRSTTGKPILANDMHLGLNAPGIWYQMHQVIDGGKLNVTGVVVPGQPFVTAGHNDRIAWGFTNVMADDMDFYLEKVNPDDPNEYACNDGWRRMKIQREKIYVKGGTVVTKEIRFTHRGPIISPLENLTDTALSMRWTGNEYSNESRTLYLLNRAGDWSDFKNAIKTFSSVSQNVVYADVDGNIGLYCAAGVPIRAEGTGAAVMPGWTDRYDWRGLVPFELLPHQYNPPDGSLCSANNKTVGGDYPYSIGTWFAPDYRFRRIKEMLAQKQRLSMDDFKRMQADWRSKLVEDLRPDLVRELTAAADMNPLEQRCRSLLSRWDGVMGVESAAAALFEAFYIRFMRNVLKDELGPALTEEFLSLGSVVSLSIERLWANPASQWYDDAGTPDRREDFGHVVRQSFGDAVAWLKDLMGDDPDQWQWGRIHRLTLEHPLGSVKILDRLFGLNRGPYPVGGATHTVSPYQYKYSKPFAVYHGASHRHIYSLADWDTSLTIIPTGTCGVPASTYYCDQTADYLANQYRADIVSRDRVEQSARHVMTLTPGK